tara:strand:+ start:6076 stop:7101 length:1026 start_codon:yes stop_codon:yes gene_type:complete
MTALSRGHSVITKDISDQFILVDQVGDTLNSISGIDASVRLVLSKNLIFRELLIENSKPMTVWINNRLNASNIYTCTIPRDQIYIGSSQDSIILIIQGIQEIEDLQAYLIGLNSASSFMDLNGTKKVNNQYDFFIIQVLVLLFVTGLMKRFDLNFLLSLVKRPFLFPSRELKGNFTIKENYKFLIRGSFISTLLGISYWFLENYQLGQSYSLRGNLVSWLIYSLYAFGLLLIKYIMVYIFGYIHQLKPLSHYQFSAFINFTMATCLIFLIFVNTNLWFSFYEPNALTDFWNYYFLGAIILFYIYLFFYMSFKKEGRNFHIISYLCSTEILGIFYIAIILIK